MVAGWEARGLGRDAIGPTVRGSGPSGALCVDVPRGARVYGGRDTEGGGGGEMGAVAALRIERAVGAVVAA